MMKEIYLAGGCFWGTEKYLASLPGVEETQVGYANGRTRHPTYEQVCREHTGHAETVRVVFSPEKLPVEKLLQAFFESHDPTSLNRQGNDIGTQYRSAIFPTNDETHFCMCFQSYQSVNNMTSGLFQPPGP